MSEFLSSKAFTLLYISSTLLMACQWLGGSATAAPTVTVIAHSNQNNDGGNGRKPQTVGSNHLIHQQQKEEHQPQQLQGQYYPPVFSAEQLLALQNTFRSPQMAADDATQLRPNVIVNDEEGENNVDDGAVVLPQWLLRHNDRVPVMVRSNAMYAPPMDTFSAVRQLPVSDQHQQKRSFAYFGDRSQPLSGLIYAPARG